MLSRLELRKHTGGFTLVEIMVVVLIIGIILAIAIPNFIKASESSRTKVCVSNLKKIQAAKQQWAMDNKRAVTSTPTTTDLYGAGRYIETAPTCPAGGVYTIGAVNTVPRCSTGGTHKHP